jgi:hypothetical protein
MCSKYYKTIKEPAPCKRYVRKIDMASGTGTAKDMSGTSTWLQVLELQKICQEHRHGFRYWNCKRYVRKIDMASGTGSAACAVRETDRHKMSAAHHQLEDLSTANTASSLHPRSRHGLVEPSSNDTIT